MHWLQPMIHSRKLRANVLRLALSLMFFLPSTLMFGQQTASADESSALCKMGTLPPDVQGHLRGEFGSWKIQVPTNLSTRARERWKSEKPLECPGIAVGRFEKDKTPSYAVLLVPQSHSGAGYKLLVFTPQTGQSPYEMRVVEQSSDSGAANLFIHRVPISKFFDEESRKKFQAQTSDGILFADAAEKEYETDIYFWANGSYQHQPVDY
jgi:hypothetical protein